MKEEFLEPVSFLLVNAKKIFNKSSFCSHVLAPVIKMKFQNFLKNRHYILYHDQRDDKYVRKL